ncbi:MAG: 2-oxo acid dehydrogenase subunit E2, partial [Acidobacteriota bacterium]|nr:2-oxo acid dehydrogenase subunit E2 [Acidobacteriota bacterium]
MSEKTTNLSEYIAENFGANASYVEGLLNRYKSDPNLVDESWRTFFTDLMNGNTPTDGGNKQSATATGEKAKSDSPVTNGATTTKATAQTAAQPVKTPPTVTVGADTEVKAITGASKKIVENMEQSLTVPTATSLRRVPVKVLEENRRIINEQMQSSGRSKVSFTHLIAWAIVKSIKQYPQMNFGYGLIDGKPSRLESGDANLGIAIDIEKKDGSRNLLVPNIKGANRMNFVEFFAAYNEQVKKARDGKLIIEDFQGTTVSLTNPGTIGTVASNPRLMSGQG